MGWGFDCLCWPWGRAFDRSCSHGGEEYLNISSPDVGPTWRYLTAESDERD